MNIQVIALSLASKMLPSCDVPMTSLKNCLIKYTASVWPEKNCQYETIFIFFNLLYPRLICFNSKRQIIYSSIDIETIGLEVLGTDYKLHSRSFVCWYLCRYLVVVVYNVRSQNCSVKCEMKHKNLHLLPSYRTLNESWF